MLHKNTMLLSCRTPRIVFNNTDDENESVLDAKARLRALRLGVPAPAPVWEADERRLYSGAENPLVYGRHHNIQFQCSFDMTYYPFDVQRCHMIFLRNPGAGKFLLRSSKSTQKCCTVFPFGTRRLLCEKLFPPLLLQGSP